MTVSRLGQSFQSHRLFHISSNRVEMMLGQRRPLVQRRRMANVAAASPLKRPRSETAERAEPPRLKKPKHDVLPTDKQPRVDEHKEQDSEVDDNDAIEPEHKQAPSSSRSTSASKPAALSIAAAATASAASSTSTSTTSSRSWTTLRPPLHPLLLSYIASRSFDQMTPVQAATIPLFSSYKDVCVQAVTGSGKTLAFLLPIVQRLLTMAASTPLDTRKVYALIISPTRELALQIHDEVQRIITYIQSAAKEADSSATTHITASAIIGGHTAATQSATTATHIITATPGRLEHLLSTSQLNVSALEVLVLDEADRLLELGFEGSVDNIMRRLPKQRRTGLFSATQTTAVKQLSRAGLRNPVIVDVTVAYKANNATANKTRGGGEESADERKDSVASGGLLPIQATPQSLHNYYHVLSPALKLTFLIDFLLAHRNEKVIVFFLTCACVDYFHLLLRLLPLSSPLSYVALHGHKTQKQRKAALALFKRAGVAQVLLSTDVAARGVDIEDVRWIVQFDAPLDAAVFVHRIGRTARMGREGESLLLLAPNEDAYIPYLHRMHVPISPFVCRPALPVSASVSSSVKQLALADRAVFEAAQAAVVSYIRAYKEHGLALLFRVQEMSWTEVGHGYGLLMWPVLPDMKWLHVSYDSGVDGAGGGGVKGRDIRYKDARKERDRQARLELDGQRRRQEKQQREDEEREARRKRDERRSSRAVKERRKERTTMGQRAKEWNELQYEAKLIKQLKARKISKEEYDQLMQQADGDELLEVNGEEGGQEEDEDEDDEDDDAPPSS